METEASNSKYPKVPKWGFGMAPLSKTMRERYDTAVRTLLLFMADEIPSSEVQLEAISELKGMFNRCLKKDQWDWFTVYEKLGHPPRNSMKFFVHKLVELRQGLKVKDLEGASSLKKELANSNLCHFLSQWQKYELPPTNQAEHGWLYILSTRDQPDILKIGMTTRSVPKRVQEINSATGELHPYSARTVFEVKRAREADRRVFALLSDYRIREDREFFHIPFAEAARLIEEELSAKAALKRQQGQVKWFNESKCYGFLEYGQQDSSFVHISDFVPETMETPKPGQKVEFDLANTSKGLKAIRVVIVES